MMSATLCNAAATCERKAPYWSYASALYAAQNLFARTREIVYPYRCGICRLFHNGHAEDLRPLDAIGNYDLRPTPKHKPEKAKKKQRISVIENNRRQAEYSAALKAEKAAKRGGVPFCNPVYERTPGYYEEKRFRHMAYMTWIDDGGPIREDDD